ncbi:MAG: hypothetical protein HYZ73_04450 [Elusimicrobia bacterium]|nr:hypothetical protein [Elusimicrobiota bacterium]
MLNTLIGTTGLLMLLAAFSLNAVGRMNRASPVYDGLNALGASALVWYGLVNDTPVFVAMEAIWALIALVMLMPKVVRRHRP